MPREAWDDPFLFPLHHPIESGPKGAWSICLQLLLILNQFLSPALLPACKPLPLPSWTSLVVFQLVSPLLLLLQFILFATQQPSNTKVRSRHFCVPNPIYLRVKGNVFTGAHKALHGLTPLHQVSSWHLLLSLSTYSHAPATWIPCCS